VASVVKPHKRLRNSSEPGRFACLVLRQTSSALIACEFHEHIGQEGANGPPNYQGASLLINTALQGGPWPAGHLERAWRQGCNK